MELVDADAAIRAGLDGVEHVTSFGTALAEPDEPNASAKPSQPTTRLAAKRVTSFGAGWTSTLPLAFDHSSI